MSLARGVHSGLRLSGFAGVDRAGLGEGKKSSTGRGPAPRPQDFGPRAAGEDRPGRLSVCGEAARSPRTSGCARASARRPVSARFRLGSSPYLRA